MEREQVRQLWRPVGKIELDLIEASNWTAFPARLPEQPIFYPVLNREYAQKIARDWNFKREGAGLRHLLPREPRLPRSLSRASGRRADHFGVLDSG